MKKTLCILLSLIFLTSILSACTDGGSESSAVSEQTSDNVFDDSSELSSDTSSDTLQVKPEKINMYVSHLPDIEEEYTVLAEKYYHDGNEVGECDIEPEVQTIEELLGHPVSLKYAGTYRHSHFDLIAYHYASDDEKIMVYLDSETGRIKALAYNDDFQRDKRVDIGTAKNNATNFIDSYFSDYINLSEYDEFQTHEHGNYYKFYWKKHLNGVLIEYIEIKTDLNGNVHNFYHIWQNKAVENIPNHTNEEYLEIIKTELQAIYDKVSEENLYKIDDISFAEINPLTGSKLTSVYSYEKDMYFVTSRVTCTVNGSEVTITVYLPYADSSDVKR